MKKIVLIAIGVAGIAMAGTKSYSFTLFEPALLGATRLPAGDYKVSVVDEKAVIRNGKMQNEAAVKVESSDNKYNGTTVRFTNADGKMHIQEIHIGGTNTKLVFGD